jgi:hypothetical protein
MPKKSTKAPRAHKAIQGRSDSVLSILAAALADGQEIKMHQAWKVQGRKKGRNEFCVRIYGDCFIEAEDVHLETAIERAGKLYLEWMEKTE